MLVGVCLAQSLVFRVVSCKSLLVLLAFLLLAIVLSFVLLLLAIVLSVLLQVVASDCFILLPFQNIKIL
jgi:hypothetical protein